MRVLDLGSGPGHVTHLVAELVGEKGAVVGLERDTAMLDVARERTRARGFANVSFHEADVTTWSADEPFDAVVGRLILFHLPDPEAVVRHHLRNLRSGGLMLALDYDIGAARSEPPLELVTTAVERIEAAFRAAGAWPRIGGRLGELLRRAGLDGVTTIGVQAYLPPDSPAGPALITGVLRTLAPVIIERGIATEEELGLETLERRLAEALVAADAVVLPPTVVGAWSRRETPP